MITLFLSIIETEQGKRLFETIYYNYRTQMHYVAKNILHDDFLAEDATQDALLGIAKTIDKVQFECEAMVKAYVLTAAKRAALRIKETEDKHHISFDELQFVTPAIIPDSSNHIENRESLGLLIKIILNLPQQYRDVLLYHSVYGMSSVHIADLLDKPQGAIRKQLFRARQLLIDSCKKEGIELEM